MAIGMKQWLGIAGAACVLVAIVALPPRTPEGDPNPLPPAQARYRRVNQEVDRARRGLVARRWADSLSSRAMRDAVDGLALGLPERNQVTEEGLDEWRRSLSDQLDTLSRRAEGTVIGFYYQSLNEDREGGARAPALRATFAGTHDGTAYCLRVTPDADVFDADLRRLAQSGLRACRLYAKYGMPGPQIQRWIRAGNAGFATRSYPGEAEREDNRYGQYRLFPIEAPVFGMNRYLYGVPALNTVRCVARRADACAEAFTNHGADRAARSPAAADDLATAADEELLDFRSGFVYEDQYLLADLEREFGEDAFARFWRSQEPVPDAFEAAFGTGVGEWVLNWVEAEIGFDDAGPALPSGTFLPTLLTFMALAAGASLAQVRRRVA